MQTYKTVGDIIDFLESYHRQLNEFYRKNKDAMNSERVKMLLAYTSRHEKNIQDVLENISGKDRDIILKTWVQFIPFTETVLTEDQWEDPEEDLDSVVQQVLELDDNLIRFYDKMIHQSGIPAPVQEFFQHLIFLEEREKAQIAQAAQQIKDF